MKQRITLNHFVQLAAGNVSRIYGLDKLKGSITEGKHADIAVWDPDVTRRVTATDLHDNMDYTPYEGMEIRGWPVTVIRRGEVIIEDNQLKAERGSGRFMERDVIDTTGMPGELAPELDMERNFGTDLGL